MNLEGIQRCCLEVSEWNLEIEGLRFLGVR
jgi:hypothetical protein